MPRTAEAGETVLIVDDEEPVRKTFREWLDGADLGCRILAAADAEAALVQADRHLIDLAILDWNLGAGNDGLRLLEDLYLFNPDVIAIMITGYAHQATPLDAMRMGVRDYLDKNQDLDRTTFLAAVRRQLERIRPAKRERRLHLSLVTFREAVEKVLPLVQSAAALNDPVPLPEAVRSLFRFLLRTTGARDGVLLAAHGRPAWTAHRWQLSEFEQVDSCRCVWWSNTVLPLPCPTGDGGFGRLSCVSQRSRRPGTQVIVYDANVDISFVQGIPVANTMRARPICLVYTRPDAGGHASARSHPFMVQDPYK